MEAKEVVQNQKIKGLKVGLSREFRKNMTEAEHAFWLLARNRKLYNLKFRRQQIIDGFIVDFFCNEIGLIIEIDGSVHEEKDKRFVDNIRDELFNQKGLKVLRFSNYEVLHEPESVKEKIRLLLIPPSP